MAGALSRTFGGSLSTRDPAAAAASRGLSSIVSTKDRTNCKQEEMAARILCLIEKRRDVAVVSAGGLGGFFGSW
jgi:hypothetical protein